jgi:hypothetical protein
MSSNYIYSSTSLYKHSLEQFSFKKVRAHLAWRHFGVFLAARSLKDRDMTFERAQVVLFDRLGKWSASYILFFELSINY